MFISKRFVVADGKRFGDRKKDTIVGKNGKVSIVTLVERNTDFRTIDDLFIEQIQHKINRRPREKLNFKTPKECFLEYYY